MICPRCQRNVQDSICSFFNTEDICLRCAEKEQSHPKYPEAREAEQRAVLAGNYNFPGIGLPEDLQGASV